LRDTAAHDINYLAMSGLLHRLVARGDGLPELPLADLIGGGLSGALNALALLLRARTTGIGGHADLALADGVPLLPSELTAAALSGQPLPEGPDSPWSGEAPNYRIYALADGHVAVGAVEPRFWENFRRRMGLEDAPPEDSAAWPGLTARIAARFRTMTRAGAEALFDGADACVTVLRSPAEACGSDLARDRAHTAPAPA